MKKIAILSSIFIGVLTWAQGIKFEDSNFASILAKAKKKKNWSLLMHMLHGVDLAN